MHQLRAYALAMVLLACPAVPLLATPSSVVWTVCSAQIQPAGVTRLGVDNFFSFGSSGPHDAFATDVGPEFGAQLTPSLAAEYGFDIFGSPSEAIFSLNAKIGFRDGAISPGAPAIQLGFFGFGTESGDTNNRHNIVHLIFGKSFSCDKTRVAVSGYYGNAETLRSSNGGLQNVGYMASIYHQVNDRWALGADYASGMNPIGGGGFGAFYFFTNDISLLMGPVWFNDTGINGDVKATVQLDINF